LLLGLVKLVYLDESTEVLSKARFARVAIEIDLHQPLVPGLMSLWPDPTWCRFGKFLNMNTFISFVSDVIVLVIES